MKKFRGDTKSSKFKVDSSESGTPNSELRTPNSVRSARGATQIEFILTILVIIFVIFWMWELVMVTYTLNVLSDAAKEGVRYAIVHSNLEGDPQPPCPGGDTANIVSRVNKFAKLSFHNISAMTVNVDYQNGCAMPGNWVRVYVAYKYVPYINLPVKYWLHASAEGRIVF